MDIATRRFKIGEGEFCSRCGGGAVCAQICGKTVFKTLCDVCHYIYFLFVASAIRWKRNATNLPFLHRTYLVLRFWFTSPSYSTKVVTNGHLSSNPSYSMSTCGAVKPSGNSYSSVVWVNTKIQIITLEF